MLYIYDEGKLYAVDGWGVLMCCNIIDPSFIEIIAMGKTCKFYYGRNNLVMASGRLLLVSRIYGEYI